MIHGIFNGCARLAGRFAFGRSYQRHKCFAIGKLRMLTPSFAANVPLERVVFVRYFVSFSASDCALFWQGFESTLTALITRWQKGFRNYPFHHFF
jgi:hypothetical protein